MPAARPRAALVGASHWHAPLYLPPLTRHFDITVVTDPNPERARQVALGVGARVVGSAAEIHKADVEVAVVLGRHDQMHAAAAALIGEGIPLLLEKPGALNSRQLAALARAASSAGVPVAVPLVHRWGPVSRALRSVREPRYFSASYIVGPPGRYSAVDNAWMLNPAASGGGPLANVGVHLVDLFLQLTGTGSADVKATMQRSIHHLAIEDHAAVLLHTPGGHSALIEVGYAFPTATSKRFARFSLAGDDGFVSIGSDGRVTNTTLAGAITEEVIDVDSDPLFGDFVDLFVAGLNSGFAGLPTLDELAKSMTIVEAAYVDAGLSQGTGATWAS